MSVGCLSASLAGSVAFAAVAAGAALALRPLSGDGEPWIWASLVAWGCALAAVVQVPDARRELRILRDAASGAPPDDGSEAVISGTIRSAAPLRAPFSGEPVAAYEYAVRQRKGGGVSTDDTCSFGSATTPLVLETAHGPLPLLGFQALFGSTEREIDKAIARPAFDAFAAETTFVRPVSPSGLARAGRDGTAEHRSDWKHWDGETVTIRGVYRAGLGLAADLPAGVPLALFPGDVASGIRRARARLRDVLVGAVLFTLLAATTVAACHRWLESRLRQAAGPLAAGQACNRVLLATLHDCTPDPIALDPIAFPIALGELA